MSYEQPTEIQTTEIQPIEIQQPTEIINTVLCSCGSRIDTTNILKHELSEEHIYILYYNN